MSNYLYILKKHEHKNDNIRLIGITNNLHRKKYEYNNNNLYPVEYDGYFTVEHKVNIFDIQKTLFRELEPNRISGDFFRIQSPEIIKNILPDNISFVSEDDIVARYLPDEEKAYINFEIDKLYGK